MTLLYKRSERKGSAASPVYREMAVGDAVGDATDWLPLGNGEATFEIRGVSMSGTRTQTDENNVSQTVNKYVKNRGSMASSVVIETKQSYEEDDQAGIIATITGPDYVKKMVTNEVADFVRLRVVTKDPADPGIFMSAARRATYE